MPSMILGSHMNHLILEACTILFPVTKEEIEVPRGGKPRGSGLIVNKARRLGWLEKQAPEPFSRGQQWQGVIFLPRGSLGRPGGP